MTKTSLKWLQNLAFEAEADGISFKLDSSVDKGGENLGPRPKPLLLVALSGCTGMDVVSILKKMRIENYTLNIEMEADTTDEHPKTYHTIRMKFYFEGQNLPLDKIINAVQLSSEKYCGVNAMLKKAAVIKSIIVINNQEVWND